MTFYINIQPYNCTSMAGVTTKNLDCLANAIHEVTTEAA